MLNIYLWIGGLLQMSFSYLVNLKGLKIDLLGRNNHIEKDWNYLKNNIL